MNMMIKNNYTNPAFKGYKNIIANDIKSNGSRFAFITGQLDDIGKKDLSQYKAFKQLAGCPSDKNNEDLFSCIYSRVDREALFLNTDSMYFGNQLRDLSNHMPFNQYIKEEKSTLKAYTLLASITNQMMHNGLCTHDKDIARVYMYALNIFSQLFDNKELAAQMLNIGMLKNISLEKIGCFFNRGIAHTMTQFFK